VSAGRARERQKHSAEAGKPRPNALAGADQPTIACVSGFLVRMLERAVQLVTPTRATDRWPLGYRIIGERHFETPREFREAIDGLIAAHMPQEVGSADVLGFRGDLDYAPRADGFALQAANRRLQFGGFAGAGLLGEMLSAGDMTAASIESVLARHGADIFLIADAIQQLFDRGLLNDDLNPGAPAR
jgi:hypothetical protein